MCIDTENGMFRLDVKIPKQPRPKCCTHRSPASQARFESARIKGTLRNRISFLEGCLWNILWFWYFLKRGQDPSCVI